MDFFLYKKGSLASLAKRDGLKIGKLDFPYLFNTPKNYNYKGPLPSNKFYTKSFEKSPQNAKLLDEIRTRGTEWEFKKELVKYCHRDVEVLALLATNFVKESLEFQKTCCKNLLPITYEEHMKGKKIWLLHPYASPFFTISSYVFGTWRYFGLRDVPLYALNDEKGGGTIRTSKMEQEWVQYIQWKKGASCNVESTYTSPKQPVIGLARPDFVIHSEKLVGEFKGCSVHGRKELS